MLSKLRCPLCDFTGLVLHAEHYCYKIVPNIGRRTFVNSAVNNIANISYVHEDRIIFELKVTKNLLITREKIGSYKYNVIIYSHFDYKKYEYFIDVINELLLFE